MIFVLTFSGIEIYNSEVETKNFGLRSEIHQIILRDYITFVLTEFFPIATTLR